MLLPSQWLVIASQAGCPSVEAFVNSPNGELSMKNFLLRLWKEEEGAETAEWLVIVALIVVIAVFVYNTTLRNALVGLVGQIVTAFGTIPGS
jgi:Flp pilus assembly pilin Flp